MALHKILPPGAEQNTAKLRKDIEEYHIAYGIDFDETDIDAFIARRPDSLEFFFLCASRIHQSNGH